MFIDIIGNVSFYDMNMYFFIYAFLGWIAEVIYSTLKTGRFINRGFLSGPVCPIYGVGMAVVILLLNTLREKWWLLFIVGSLLCSVLELLTGVVLEKIFKVKWWDYSNEKFNLKGYICLKFSLIWGLAVVLLFYTLVPLFEGIVDFIPTTLGLIILGIMWAVLIVDITVSVMYLSKLFGNIKKVKSIKNSINNGSDKIGEKVSNIALDVEKKAVEVVEKFKRTRIYKAFPKLAEGLEQIIEKIKPKK